MTPVDTGTQPPLASGGSVRSRRAALLLCIVGFGGIGLLLQLAAAHGARKEPLSLPEDLVPWQVGQWSYQDAVDGWLAEGYPIGHTLYRYKRADGTTMLVTAAVGQERYGAFANIAPTFLQRGHEKIDALSETAEEPGSGRQVSYRVSVYQGAGQEGPFAFVGLYWNGRRLTTSLSAVKVLVTLRRAMGIPQPTVAVYFSRPMADPGEKDAAAADVADFARAFLPTLEELRGTYARSGS